MSLRKYILLSAVLLSLLSEVNAQIQPTCTVSITVADTLFVPDPQHVNDSVRYHLLASEGADSLHWWPDSLFANPSAAEQWVTLGCHDSLRVGLTAFFNQANLFHWQQPGFLRSHTSYTFVPAPDSGDLCQPRSIAYDAYPQNYCNEMDYNTPQQGIIIRPDTLWSYGDSVYPFSPNLSMTFLRNFFPTIREFPFDGNHVPFYVDTIEMLDPDTNYLYVLNMTHYTLSQYDDSLYSVPVLYFTINIDDTVPRFFSEGHTVSLRDTTLFYYLNFAIPHSIGGIGRYRHINSTVNFNMRPSPRGRAVFRFYEAPTPYYYTTGSYGFSRIEMAGRCAPTDTILLTGPHCGCLVFDTVSRAVCRNQIPYTWDGLTFTQPGSDTLLITALACDTLRHYTLTLRPNDTLSRFDTVEERQLPWILYGDTMTASGLDTILVQGIPPDCDTLLYYHLTVLYNQFDTTYTYICPGQLPYTLHGVTAYSDTVFNITLQGSEGQDSIVTYFIYVKADSDTAIYDTIVENQLPWAFLDSLFSDTVANFPFVLVNEAGCDSIIYYNLHVFWNGDHCDSSLSFPNVVTPNGDGLNDRFVIGGLVENQCYPYNLLIIFDRTGRIVFRAENICRDDQFWDPAASRIPAGTYFYRFVGHGVNHATQHQGCIEILK
ncbi:MAG: gliding motility-associated C-terminal domain-containing protein [Bacteroidales bacterium]|nr:gliding motility-associated C-terminal domain-containing protein [Bacteroidales bacterium]